MATRQERERVYHKGWRKGNLDKTKKIFKKFYGTPLGRYSNLTKKQTTIRYPVLITKVEFVAWATKEENKICHYCGTSDLGVGTAVDRVNNNLPYQLDNIVTCCKHCNFAKHTKSIEEFKEHITKIYEYYVTKK